MLSNLEQVRARDGMVIAIASEGDDAIAAKANDVIYVPDLGEYLTAILVDGAAPAARLPRRDAQGHRRRSAAQPREERDGRVAARSLGLDRPEPDAASQIRQARPQATAPW